MIIIERMPHESARDYALRSLKLNISNGVISPGSKINDQEIAACLGVSRTPVREALIELSKYNLIEMYPQKASVVAPVSYRMIREAAVAREALECAAVSICCKMTDPSVFARIAENIELMQFYISKKDQNKNLELDVSYHRELFTIAGMPLSHDFLCNLEIHYRRIIGLSFYEGKEYAMVEDHRSILDAILAHDEEKAIASMKKHLNLDLVSKEEVLKICPDCVFD